MEAKHIIYSKLEAFIKKFYTNEIIKGSLLFIGIGLLYFIFTLLVEHFLWLSTAGRTILFWLFITFEIFLLFRFILFPLFKLFKFKAGINFNDASYIIGNHFPEVSDKLLNFLQLSSQTDQSELLIASIEQKGNALHPIPFSNAVDFSKNKKYLPFAIIPVVLLILFFISGNSGIISNSFNRVVHYQTEYLPPAPFQFKVLNVLEVEQGNDYVLQVAIAGEVFPENVKIVIDSEEYFLEAVQPNLFQYRFSNVISDTEFHLFSNEVVSHNYILKVIDVPTISNFIMTLQFPNYLNRKNEIVEGNGNAIVPEGTVVKWNVTAQATDAITFVTDNHKVNFDKIDNSFNFSKVIRSDLKYEIITSNATIKEHERLGYSITTIKDQFPTITAQFVRDTLQSKKNVIVGQVADDYGLSKLRVVYYPIESPENLSFYDLAVKKSTVDQFIYTFPSGIRLKDGILYEYYFEVFDNDLVNSYKSTKSSIFKHYVLTEAEIKENNLIEQHENINSLEKSIQSQDKQLKELDKLQKVNKEKSALDFKDQKKIDSFLKQQKQQDEMMKEFSKKLSENLEEFNPNVENKDKEELQRRLEELQKDTDENEKLLKELEELSKKLEKDQLFEKADKLKQNAKSQKMNLEQLVELTKRFYVEQKAEQLAEKMQDLGKRQEDLPDNAEKNTSENQEKLNKEFDALQDELKELDKENDELKAPLDIPNDELEQKDIDKEMDNAKEELDKKNQKNATPKQKSAGKKMQELSKKMDASLAAGSMEQMEEDAKALRQILDNLLTFSFNEERLMLTTKDAKTRSLQMNKVLKEQQNLKVQFKHVDDSLFAVALRNPMISEIVLNEVGEIHYNLDKSLETLADNNIFKGTSHQQYTLSSANKLADFLSDVANQMQMQMQGAGSGKSGKGSGKGMQLPDIIKKQEALSEKMKNGMKPGEQPGMKPGSKPGESQQQGNSGKPGSSGEDGSGGDGEAGKVLDILKEQKQLREALEKELQKQGLNGLGQNAMNQMKDIEKQLINKGFKNETLNKMLNLKHELLKLDKAIQQQGQDSKRKSNSNSKDFDVNSTALSPALKEYLQSIEILNRQSLPLQPNYNQKVQQYFKTND